MKYITKIEINYFRSIYKIVIKDLDDVNAITGKNDSGKSNVLKALNLFFNNWIVRPNDFDFYQNYNFKRLHEVRKDTIKGKQFIQIKVTFERGNSFPGTLPERFTVTKKWNRDDKFPTVSDNIESQLKKEKRKCTSKNRASLTKFLNGIKYLYIPAIKDERIFEEMILQLQDAINRKELASNTVLTKSIKDLYDNVSVATEELSAEFKRATSIDSQISTPQKVEELYKSLKITTKIADDSIPLAERGDGIRVRYIPSIMNYLSCNSNEKFVWGFEEPENSLEFNMARYMATDFYKEYSINSQIILTTHSPAFIALADKDRARGYRCYRDDNDTQLADFRNAVLLQPLEEELGYAQIWQEKYNDYERIAIENEEIKRRAQEISLQFDEIKRPVLLTEGKTDAQILSVAWKKLYGENCPFDIKSCSLLSPEDKEEIAGADVLNKILCSVRYDYKGVIIGLFDNDEKGVSAYKLDNNYIDCSKWKKHKNKKGYAIVIPASNDELKLIEKAKNLSIEFLFSKNTLLEKFDGKGLTFKDLVEQRTIFGKTVDIKTVSMTDSEEWYFAQIDSRSKGSFAYEVVPSLKREAFINFEPLFALINEILVDISNN